ERPVAARCLIRHAVFAVRGAVVHAFQSIPSSPVRHAGSPWRPKFCRMLHMVDRWSRLCPIGAVEWRRHGGGDRPMFRTPQPTLPARPCGGRRGVIAAGLAVLLSACSGTLSSSHMFGTSSVAPG